MLFSVILKIIFLDFYLFDNFFPKKFNKNDQFLTKIRKSKFDLIRIRFSKYFYWIQIRVFSYLHCKLKINRDINDQIINEDV